MTKITTKFISNTSPTNAINIYWDSDLKGFGLCVRPSGKKTFILKYRVGRGRKAKLKKQTIGTTGVISVNQARITAKQWIKNDKNKEKRIKH